MALFDVPSRYGDAILRLFDADQLSPTLAEACFSLLYRKFDVIAPTRYFSGPLMHLRLSFQIYKYDEICILCVAFPCIYDCSNTQTLLSDLKDVEKMIEAFEKLLLLTREDVKDIDLSNIYNHGW
jgi:hypothetical protein